MSVHLCVVSLTNEHRGGPEPSAQGPVAEGERNLSWVEPQLIARSSVFSSVTMCYLV